MGDPLFWSMLATSALINVSVSDDLVVDFLATGIARFSAPHSQDGVKIPDIGVFVANYDEADVLPTMVRGNLAAIPYPSVKLILGVYPNDTATLNVALELEKEYPARVRVIVNTLNGPTSKGQLLNLMFEKVFGGDAIGAPDIAILHDSEDRIDPRSFPIYASYVADGYDFVQTPVYSLPSGHRSLTAATYEDSFAESHTRAMIVRNALGVAVPSAGVGTGMSKKLLRHFLKERGTVLKPGTVVEDYMLGHEAYQRGFKCAFAAVSATEKRGLDYIATREYFPSGLYASIKQKSRWTYGIAFEGTKKLGWYGGFLDRWFLWRDRKGAITSFLAPLAFVFCALSVFGFIDFDAIPEDYVFMLGVSMKLNLFGASVRYLVRMSAHRQVYGTYNAFGILHRWPVEIYVDFRALLKAWRMFLIESKFATRPVVWTKTAHEVSANMFATSTRAP